MLKSAEDAQVDEVHTNHTLSIKHFFSLSFLQTINDVMQPSAAKAVRKWMKTADNKGYTLHATASLHIITVWFSSRAPGGCPSV